MRRHRRSRGQSTVEFALMMPVIMAFFFWIFEINIYMTAANQTAYASYASARALLVSHGNMGRAQGVKDEILTGKLFTDTGVGFQQSTLRKGPDGVILRLQGLASLPYSRTLLNFASEVPTHLGPDEWNRTYWPDPFREQDMGGMVSWYTDNNLPVH